RPDRARAAGSGRRGCDYQRERCGPYHRYPRGWSDERIRVRIRRSDLDVHAAHPRLGRHLAALDSPPGVSQVRRPAIGGPAIAPPDATSIARLAGALPTAEIMAPMAHGGTDLLRTG